MSISLTDPLSEVTRKERRMLLGLSMLGIFFTYAGALPTKIAALGVELETTDQNAFLYLMSFGLFYFTVAFFIYAISDFIVWRNAVAEAYISSYEAYMNERESYPTNQYDAELDTEKQVLYKRNKIWNTLTKPVSITRAAFDFLLPVLVGIFSISIMLLHAFENT